jgi:hypothetical protein
MLLNTIKISEEKLKYLIGMSLQENNFEVIDFDIDFDTYTPNTTTSETPTLVVDSYNISITTDYNGVLQGDDPRLFAKDFLKMLELVEKSVSTYIVDVNGKITTDTSNAYISEPMIIHIDYSFEEKHKTSLSFYVRPKT